MRWLQILRLAFTPRSLTRSLFLRMIVVMMFGVAVIAVVAETTVSSRIDQVFDQQLVLGANLLVNLMRDELQDIRKPAKDGVMEVDDMPLLSAEDREAFDAYANWRMFRIWYYGHLRLKSDTGPDLPPPTANQSSGFRTATFKGERWRIYTLAAVGGEPVIQVGERLQVRKDLVSEIALQLAAPFILIALLLLLVIWFSLRTGLKDLDDFSSVLSHSRSQPPFVSLRTENWPSELTELITVINGLFQRIEGGMLHERKFIDMAAHQLRTPLAGLSLEAQLCARITDRTELNERLGKLNAATQRIARLVDQLLGLSRLDTLAAVDGAPFSCKSFMGVLLADMAPLMVKRNIEVAFEGEDFDYAGSETALGLILANLLENALSHSPDGGEVVINLERSADGTKGYIDISDMGRGLSDEDKIKAFDRFWRAPDSHVQGSGLGLSIAREAAATLDADLGVYNRPDGKSGLVARLVLTL